MSDVVNVALAVAVRGGRVLVARRPDHLHQGGVWEFPGGKVEAGEKPAEAVRRELREETGLSGGEIDFLTRTEHAYPERRVRLHVYVVWEPGGETQARPAPELRWLSPGELSKLTMPEANGPVVEAVKARLAV